MHSITLVCSAHSENGACNVGELLKILRGIEPEIVFEEVRPQDFDAYYKHGTLSHLESRAIRRYRESKSILQIPVDRHDSPDNSVFAEIQNVFDCVEQNSKEYLALDEESRERVFIDGFRYLNSRDFVSITARSCEIEDRVITQTGDRRLMYWLEKWRYIHQTRELEMIGNIYQYCRENVVGSGVFLVGAAHKAGLIKAIERHERAETKLINWNLAYD
jgi:hypothetical protein